MALNAAVQFEVRQGSLDTNGGGFQAGASGTDYSLQANANSGGSNGSTTDAVAVGTGVITSATAAFTSAIVGNVIYLQGGTGTLAAGWYQVTVFTNVTTITVDRNVAAGTGITMNIGGALGTPGQAAATMNTAGVSGIKTWVKYSTTTFSLTSATPGTGGPISLTVVGTSMEGYDQVRGDRTGNRPLVSWASVASPGSGTTYIFTGTASGANRFANLVASGNNVANVGGFNTGGNSGNTAQCVAENMSATLGVGFLNGICIQCSAVSCLLYGYSTICQATDCWATLCGTGFYSTSRLSYTKCIAYSCTSWGFNAAQGTVFNNCIADSCGTNTVVSGGYIASNTCLWLNSIASNNFGTNVVGWDIQNSFSNSCTFMNCAQYGNTTNVIAGGIALSSTGTITLTAQPYMTPGSDFRPNTTSGGGAALRNTGIGVYGQTDNVDVGAVRHTDPSGSGGYFPAAKQLGF